MHAYGRAPSATGAIAFLFLALVLAGAAQNSKAQAHPARPHRAGWACPVAGRVHFTDTWGASRDGGARRHQGADMFAPRGTPAVAVTRARVLRAGWSGSKGGLGVTLRSARGTEFYYAHLSQVAVHRGQLVRRGQRVGRVGNTGNARTTPPHLHFEVRPGGRTVNPTPYVRAWC